jgi:hypothetical protein
MAAGVSDRLWSMEDVVALMDAAEGEPKKRGLYKARQAPPISNESLPASGCGSVSISARGNVDISLAAHRVDWLKAAKDKALGVERNFTRDL